MKEYIDNINFKDFIQNLNGLGTFITSLISLFTLIVLIRQRKDSFRPRVVFGDRVSGKCIAEDDNIFKTNWEDAYPDMSEEIHVFCFHLLNIGVGVAENVTIFEKFDYKKAIKFIRKLDIENEFIISIEKDTIVLKTTFDSSFSIIYLNNKPRELGTFITRQQEKPSKYTFTDSCLLFLSCFDYLRNKYDSYMRLDGFPSCYYEIHYSDIEGKKYCSKYKCKVDSILMDNYTFTFMKK